MTILQFDFMMSLERGALVLNMPNTNELTKRNIKHDIRV